MATLVAAYEKRLSTDFAILNASQRFDDLGTQTYAASTPGYVAMVCGSKYADVQARAERWDARPPEPGAEWEDADELPFAAVPAGEPLRFGGFDPPEPDEPGLDVTGLDRARVQVLATGRHLSAYGDTSDVPERWLLRIWPDDAPPDPLAGPPRRIAGALPFARGPQPAWHAALGAWQRAGWSMLSAPRAFREVTAALASAGRPVAQHELPDGALTPENVPEWAATLETLAAAAGLAGMATYADAVAVLERLGLLARTHDGLLVPNPAPPAAWDVLDLPEDHERGARLAVLRDDFQVFMGDVQHLLSWTGPLTATPRRLAIRLALRPGDVLGVLRLMVLTRHLTVAPGIDDAGADTTLTITSAVG
ncbi:MAG TPA: hypothetical protein VNQ77_00205 [Frankiaceae bacterium]|nr:hypothetical protein [Frankiaceae bacterium]